MRSQHDRSQGRRKKNIFLTFVMSPVRLAAGQDQTQPAVQGYKEEPTVIPPHSSGYGRILPKMMRATPKHHP